MRKDQGQFVVLQRQQIGWRIAVLERARGSERSPPGTAWDNLLLERESDNVLVLQNN